MEVMDHKSVGPDVPFQTVEDLAGIDVEGHFESMNTGVRSFPHPAIFRISLFT
jgi:hypothetical protein